MTLLVYRMCLIRIDAAMFKIWSMKMKRFLSIISLAFIIAIAAPAANAVAAYPLVNISNSTQYIASGVVEYASAFCSNDGYTVTPNTTWEASSRGVCLVTGITATVKTPNGDYTADSYTSSGTSYSQFAIIQVGENKFEVTRRVT